VEDAKDGIEYVPVSEQNLQRLQGLAFEMQLANDFYNVSLAASRIPCDIGSHKGNAQRYTLVDNLATSLHFTVLRILLPNPAAL
jgi:hypothetical protein